MAKGKSTMGNLLKAVSGNQSTTTTGKTPTVVVPEDIASAIADWHRAKREEETAIAKRKNAEEKLRGPAAAFRIEVSRTAGKVHSSVDLNGGDHGNLKYVQAASFSAMKVADGAEGQLQVIFKNDFDKYFRIKPQLKLSDEITEVHIKKLLTAFSKIFGDQMSEFVTAEPVVAGTKALADAMVFDPGVEKLSHRAQKDGWCKLKAGYFKR